MSSRLSRRQFLKLGGTAAGAVAAQAATGILHLPAFAQATKTLRIGANAWAMGLDAQNQAGPSNVGRRFFSMMYEPLMIFDHSGAVVPMLATAWENDGLQWRFTLREGVKFHDGSTMTADDVVFSFNRALSPADDQQGTVSYGTSLTQQIDKVEKTGDLEVTITTKLPDPLMIYRLATHYMPILPQAATEAMSFDQINSAPLSAGPYKVAEFTTDRLVLEKHGDYWQGAPAADEVVVRYIPENATRIGALQAGEVDLITNLPVDQIQTLTSSNGVRIESSLLLNYMSVLMNTKEGPTADANVRRALSLAIDRSLIADQLWLGYARAMDDYLLPGVVGYDNSNSAVKYDLDAARAALEASSYSGEPIRFSPVANYYSNSDVVTQVINEMWQQIGVTTTYEPMEMGGYFQAYMGGELTSNIQSYDLFGDAMFMFQLYQPNAAIALYRPTYYEPPAEFDALVADIASKFDPQERHDDIRKMVSIFENDVPMTPVYQTVDIWGVREGINFRAHPLFEIDLRPGNFSM